jgi:SAM-dependent methyltransferase
MKNLFTSAYFDYSNESRRQSAKLVLAPIFDVFQPESILDVGCGEGAWLDEAEKLGAKKLWGVDGAWIDHGKIANPLIHFIPVDFENAMPQLKDRFDLTISVEVAEHISAEMASAFVSFLCSTSNIVLFSAAVVNQGGTGHKNEQNPSYWVKVFEEYGYKCIDCMRGQLWADSRVSWWYRQNMLLFVNHVCESGKIDQLRDMVSHPLDMIHPEMLEVKLNRYTPRDIRQLFGCIKRYLISKF